MVSSHVISVFGVVALLATLIGSTPVLAQPASLHPDAATRGSADAPGAFVHERPGGLDTPELVALWRRGIAAEERDAFLAAVDAYEAMAKRAPWLAYPHWKVSRNLWRYGEALPPDAKTERSSVFARAKEWAQEGLAIDSECAECMLWKFGAMGRIATTEGIMTSLRFAPEMQGLLEKGIALRPTHADSPFNTTLGNLYYAAAVFYRVVPDWAWLDWLLGVTGDIERSLTLIREAVSITPSRIDYNVELGAVLTCYAQRKNAPHAMREAREVLGAAQRLPLLMDLDAIDLEHARVLLADSSKACGYSRDGWIDLERDKKNRRAQR